MHEQDINVFLALRRKKQCGGNTPSVYMLHNKNNQKYYIGQSYHPSDRVFTHFTGRGNGDVYADYKQGDTFTVRFYELDPCQFRDLNELEYHLIRIYQARELGYNRRDGNQTRQFQSTI